MSIKAARREAARQFTIPPDCISDEDFTTALGLSKIIVAPTGFYDEHDREQVVSVRFNPALGKAAGNLLVLKGMAVTDDPLRPSVSAHNISVAAAMRLATAERLNISTLSVGNPGVANPAWREKIGKDQTYGLVPEQHEELWSGGFSSVALAFARAAKFAINQEALTDLKVVQIAPSLNSSIACAGVGHMLDNDIRLTWLSLLDPVGLAAEKGYKRAGQFFSVDGKPYLAANHPMHRQLIENNLQWLFRSVRSPANVAYGLRGVSFGNASKDLEANTPALVDNGIGTRLYLAGGGEFNIAPGAEAAVEKLVAAGADAKLYEIEHASHALTMSAGMDVLALRHYDQAN